MKRLLSILKLEINKTVEAGYKNFITGMAKGIDLYAAQIVLEMKKTNPDIRLICVFPYKNHGSGFKGINKWYYGLTEEQADEIVILSDKYTKSCMQKRNEYMIDNSGKLIAAVSNYRSGTGQTIRYAQKQGIDIHIIEIDKNPEIFKPIYDY